MINKQARANIIKNAGGIEGLSRFWARRVKASTARSASRQAEHATFMKVKEEEIAASKAVIKGKKEEPKGAKERFSPKVYRTAAMMLAGPAAYGVYQGIQKYKQRNQQEQYYPQV